MSCEITSFYDEIYIRNFVFSADQVDPAFAVTRLVKALRENHRNRVLHNTFYSILKEKLSAGVLAIPSFVDNVVLKLPHSYELWLLFSCNALAKHIDLHQGKDGIQDFRPSTLDRESLATAFGLSLFPRSPELLALRALQLSADADAACAAALAHTATKAKALWGSHQKLLDWAAVEGLLATLQFVDSASTPSDHCSKHLPLTDSLTRLQYQPIFHATTRLYGGDESWYELGDLSHLSDHTVLNQLAPTSVLLGVDPADLTAPYTYLPALQVGCSDPSACALPGFIVADGKETASTHLVTQAHNLSMVESGTVGLLYSSHTLEHLSHNLPPPGCSSFSHSSQYLSGCQSEVVTALAEWRRVLVPGGQLLVSVPDLLALTRYFAHPSTSSAEKAVLRTIMFGGQHNALDFHKTGFHWEFLRDLLHEAGFCEAVPVSELGVFADTSATVLDTQGNRPISLNVRAVAC